MATNNKDFIVKNGLVVEGSNATVNGNEVLTTASSIDSLQDVNTTGAQNTNVLAYSNGQWLPTENTGTQGIQGTQGSQGTKGAQGTTGIQGFAGYIGADGSQGIQGTTGETGSQGTQGTVGSQGISGYVGSDGSQGTQGTLGETGSQGTQGTLGETGSQGTQGTLGETGSQGTQGTQGLQGVQGNEGQPGVSASGRIWYFTQTNSDISNYESLQPDKPDSGTQDDMQVTISSSNGPTIIEEFATDINDPNLTEIPAGEYEWRFWAYVSDATDTSTLTFDVYKRSYPGGTETYLFSTPPQEINALSISNYNVLVVATQAIPLDITDRIVVKVVAETNSTSNKTIHFVHSGNTPSSIKTAITTGYTGPQGIQGTQGTQGLFGTQGTQGTQGVLGGGLYTYSATAPISPINGDRWINSDTGIEYTYITDGDSSQWVDSRASGYVGSQGTQGVQGAEGSQGTQGLTGSGTQGSQGTQGTIGSQGATGSQGAQGTNGSQGSQGTQGTQGTFGTQGTQGVIGATATPTTPDNTTSADATGYIGMPQVLNPASPYTISAADAGKHIYMTTTGRTITIPANSVTPLEIGTTVVIINAASVSTTISINTDTLILASTGTTGSRTLGTNGMATIVKVTNTSWIISGNGVT